MSDINIPIPANSNFWDNLDNAMNNIYKNYKYYIDLQQQTAVNKTLANNKTPAGIIYSIGEALKPYTYILIIVIGGLILYKRK